MLSPSGGTEAGPLARRVVSSKTAHAVASGLAPASKDVKLGSSLWIKERDQTHQDFCWQNGDGIFSIGFLQIKEVRDYLAEQEVHHGKVSFQGEFRALLGRYEIAFDERYVWD